jgi:hypothetical protein
MPAPTYEERAGERSARELPDRRSRGQRYRANAVKETGDVADAVNNLADIVHAGVGASRPSGQRVGTSAGDYYRPDQSGPGAPDLALGIAAGAAVFAEAVRVTRDWLRRKRHRGDE